MEPSLISTESSETHTCKLTLMRYWTSGSCPKRCPFSVLIFSVRKSLVGGKSVRDPGGDTLRCPVSVSCRMERRLKLPSREGLRWKSWPRAPLYELGRIGSHVSWAPVCQKVGFGN